MLFIPMVVFLAADLVMVFSRLITSKIMTVNAKYSPLSSPADIFPLIVRYTAGQVSGSEHRSGPLQPCQDERERTMAKLS